MRDAVQRLIPAPLQPPLARMHRPLARSLVAAKYWRKYRGRFVSKIDRKDDLMHYALDVARSEKSAFRYHHAVRMYIEGGNENVDDVERVLGEVGFPLRESSSLLEFACGYGRLTRHLVHRVSPSRITVSDIDRRAVDFVTAQFGVGGFYSASRAEDLTHDGRYDAIVVVSLFSHLPIQAWGPWLERLHRMLNPGGVLLFSTLGLHAYGAVNQADKETFETVAEGFLFREDNETRGRLTGEHYGTAYVDATYVERAVADNAVGRLVKSVPRALNGFQDAYILQRAGEAG